MFKKHDLALGIVSILLGIGIIVQAQFIKVKFSTDPAGPTALPIIIAIGIIVIGVIHVAGGVYARKEIVKNPTHRTAILWFKEYQPVICIILSSLIYAGLMELIGYLILTPLFIGSILWILAERDIKRVCKVSIVMTLILFVVFRWGLQVNFPMGLLNNLF